ncbi:MAG: minor capsid protein [candidate division WOR-3 bacterium]
MNKFTIAGKFLELWFSDLTKEGIYNWQEIQRDLIYDLIRSRTKDPFHYILRNKDYRNAVIRQSRWLAYVVLWAYIQGQSQALRFSRFKDRLGITRGQYNRLWKAFRYKFFWLSLVNNIKVIEKVKDAINTAIESGMPTRDAIDHYAETLNNKRYYAETVFRTNLTSHYNLGIVDSFDTEYFEYSAIVDERTTEICRHLDGKIFRKTETSLIPPNHYNCRSLAIPTYIPIKPEITPQEIESLEQKFPEWKDFLEPIYLETIPDSIWDRIKEYVSQDEIEKINQELEGFLND